MSKVCLIVRCGKVYKRIKENKKIKKKILNLKSKNMTKFETQF